MTELEFPTRVWVRGENGKWSSRAAKADDRNRRKDLQKSWPKDPDGIKRAN